ncbi:transcriptional regulator [Halobacteriales archaeon QH_1_68_42]|nr:MAG: transcriptional regulator [Halobacteriales archaeon QH_1_68_42]
MTTNTLKITFGQADDHRRDARERLERAEASDTGEAIAQDARFILNFEDFREVATAEAVDRDYREVHWNLEELEESGVIEFEADNGRKRPILRGEADGIDISISIGPESTDPSAAAT